jgi:hypothetical protein
MTTKWTVKPFCTPHEDSDPLGVFEIKEVKAEAEKWEDASMDAAPGSDEEQHAIDRRGEVTEQAARLIATAPELLEALMESHGAICAVLCAMRRDMPNHSWIPALNKAEERSIAAIAKATGEPVMAA